MFLNPLASYVLGQSLAGGAIVDVPTLAAALAERLSGGRVQLEAPVLGQMQAAIVRGDDYATSEARALQVLATGAVVGSHKASIAHVFLVVLRETVPHELAFEGTVQVLGAGQGVKITAPLSAQQSALFKPGAYPLLCKVHLQNLHRITLAEGTLTVARGATSV